MVSVRVVNAGDNLERLVAEIELAAWDDANQISGYDVAALSAFLQRQDTLFVVCHQYTNGVGTLLGIASGRIQTKPYRSKPWLYVDEVDVCVNQRRKGAGTALMRRMLAFANQAGCEEVWLGTESDNAAANALYESLNPDDVAKVMGYSYRMS